jgi:hypothetical protein
MASPSVASLHTFFARYSVLAQNSAAEDLAAMYAPTFIVAGPRGSQAFANDSRFLQWIQQVGDFNHQHGMRTLTVRKIQELSLSPRHVLATVRWGSQFDRLGDRVIEFDIAYLLEGTGDEWKILSYVSQQDQEEQMKQLGLM